SASGSRATLGVNWQAQAASGSSIPLCRPGKCSATQNMERSFQWQTQWRGKRRAAAFDEMQGELEAGGLEREAQAGGRGFMRGSQRPIEESRGMARLRGDRQALQLGVTRLRNPCGERVAAARAQRLLSRPQGVAAARWADDQQMDQVDAGGRQSGRIRHLRRRDADGALTGARNRGDGRQDELQLADAGLVGEDLGQPLPRPAAPRKFGIQGGKAGRDGGCGAGKRAAAPHRVPLQDFLEGAHTLRILYACTVWKPLTWGA